MLVVRISRQGLPQSVEELFSSWGQFRTINSEEKTCDCCYYFKYGYCKHVLALMMIKGELKDPVLKKKNKPGRKPQIKKALVK